MCIVPLDSQFCCKLAKRRPRVEDVRRLEDFDQRHLRSIARIRWSDHVNNPQVRNLLMSTGSENVLSQRIKLSRLHWLDHELRKANARLPYFPFLPRNKRNHVEASR